MAVILILKIRPDQQQVQAQLHQGNSRYSPFKLILNVIKVTIIFSFFIFYLDSKHKNGSLTDISAYTTITQSEYTFVVNATSATACPLYSPGGVTKFIIKNNLKGYFTVFMIVMGLFLNCAGNKLLGPTLFVTTFAVSTIVLIVLGFKFFNSSIS